jgi:DNA (cytosine-5)-methyltransferase 1
MADDRGNLALEYLRLADRLRPRWLVWENVPGVLSSSGGRDFGAFLGGLAELGYGWAYRILDAQYFGLAQRRRRVFVVGHLGIWQRAAAVLFERHSLSGHPAPSREAEEESAERVAPCLDADFGRTRGASGQDANHGHGHLIPFHNRQDPDVSGDVTHPLGAQDNGMAVQLPSMAVRRLTPRECERLQGFPDDYTLAPYRGKPAADGPRYKALGNSMAVPVMRWIGERIAMVNGIVEVGNGQRYGAPVGLLVPLRGRNMPAAGFRGPQDGIPGDAGGRAAELRAG